MVIAAPLEPSRQRHHLIVVGVVLSGFTEVRVRNDDIIALDPGLIPNSMLVLPLPSFMAAALGLTED